MQGKNVEQQAFSSTRVMTQKSANRNDLYQSDETSHAWPKLCGPRTRIGQSAVSFQWSPPQKSCPLSFDVHGTD